jgi:hypothetical protein
MIGCTDVGTTVSLDQMIIFTENDERPAACPDIALPCVSRSREHGAPARTPIRCLGEWLLNGTHNMSLLPKPPARSESKRKALLSGVQAAHRSLPGPFTDGPALTRRPLCPIGSRVLK